MVLKIDRPPVLTAGQRKEWRAAEAKRILETQGPTWTNVWFFRDVQPLWETHLFKLREYPDGNRYREPLIDVDSYLEIGVCEGASMRWVLQTFSPKTAIGIDPWQPKKPRDKAHVRAVAKQKENAYVNLEPWLWKPNSDGGNNGQPLRLYEAKSIDKLATWNAIGGPECDMIYVDGDHIGPGCLTDLVLSWPLLKVRGCLIMDNYERRYELHKPSAHEAIDAFLHVYEGRYEYLWRTKSQIAIDKTTT